MKQRFRIIILLMAFSLFGIILVQVLWIRHAIRAEKARFDKSVYSALISGISQMEKEKMFYFLDSKINLPEPSYIHIDSLMNIYIPEPPEIEMLEIDSGRIRVTRRNSTIIISDSTGETRIVTMVRPADRVINLRVDSDFDYDHDVDLTWEIESDNIHEHEIEEIKAHEELTHIEELEALNEHYSYYKEQIDSIAQHYQEDEMIRAKKEVMVKEKLAKFNKSMAQWAFEYSFDEERLIGLGVHSAIDTIIGRALTNNGIKLDYNSQIVKEDNDTTIILNSSVDEMELLSNNYKTELFPNDLFRKDIYLLVDFPTKTSHIYRSVSLLAFGSMTFTIIILLTFGMTLYYISKQKKISDIKSDFINNMTHEFKTPIATINLASDTMLSPKIMGNEEKTRYYLDIIRQENKRMNNQVEKVLQMALIENQDLQLDFQKTDLHPIIENTVHIAGLTAKEKKGRIVTMLRASCSDVPVDEIHFANILNNLLDNAMKYTENAPEILVETFSKDKKVFIRISDNGLGMSKEVQKHIFEKFYRRPSGNIHNIKGFGLGLSYVKAIVDAHGGGISVSSEPGNGSIFTLNFDC